MCRLQGPSPDALLAIVDRSGFAPAEVPIWRDSPVVQSGVRSRVRCNRSRRRYRTVLPVRGALLAGVDRS